MNERILARGMRGRKKNCKAAGMIKLLLTIGTLNWQ